MLPKIILTTATTLKLVGDTSIANTDSHGTAMQSSQLIYKQWCSIGW
jgi:hypothetical protein